MFNLLVSSAGWADAGDTLDVSRVLEYTAADIKTTLQPEGRLDVAFVRRLPTLFIAESSSNVQFNPRLGKLIDVRQDGRQYHLSYYFDESGPRLVPGDVEALASALRIDDWELNRTHWAIKEADLYRVLYEHGGQAISPTVFKFKRLPVVKNLVGVMMPFDSSFDPVYRDITQGLAAGGKRCLRADNMWRDDAVVQDIVDLIQESSAVVCDLSGRNPNVFYETGIAHTLGKHVVMITQNAADVPFNLRHLRFLSYLNNEEGRRHLVDGVLSRILSLDSEAMGAH